MVSVISSDTLTLINIKIKINNIDTAPIYTNKYDKPIKFKPNKIKYKDILKNKPIRNNTETMGFLLIITKIAEMIAVMQIKVKNSGYKPLNTVSFKINRLNIKNKTNLISFNSKF